MILIGIYQETEVLGGPGRSQGGPRKSQRALRTTRTVVKPKSSRIQPKSSQIKAKSKSKQNPAKSKSNQNRIKSRIKSKAQEIVKTLQSQGLIKQQEMGEILGILALPVPVGLPVLLGGLVCALSGSLRRKSQDYEGSLALWLPGGQELRRKSQDLGFLDGFPQGFLIFISF